MAELSRTDFIDYLIGRGFFPSNIWSAAFQVWFKKTQKSCEWTGGDRLLACFVPKGKLNPLDKTFRSGFFICAEEAELDARELWLKLTAEPRAYRQPWKIRGCPEKFKGLYQGQDISGLVLARSETRKLVFLPHAFKAGAQARLAVWQPDESPAVGVFVVIADGVSPSPATFAEHQGAIAEHFGHPVAGRLVNNQTLLVGDVD